MECGFDHQVKIHLYAPGFVIHTDKRDKIKTGWLVTTQAICATL